MGIWEQTGYDVRLDWGAVLVIVDVLSFSATTDLVANRALPVRRRGVARAAGAVIVGEGELTRRPSSVTEIPPGALPVSPRPTAQRWVRPSRRPARTCSRAASATPIAAGERWGVNIFGDGETSGPLRPCVEDQMGAGAIAAALAGLGLALSAEAALAARSVDVTALATCVSSRELTEAGHGGDVVLAARTDVSDAAPVLIEGVLT